MDTTLKKLVANKDKYWDWWLEDKSLLSKWYKLSERVIKHYLYIRYKLYY